MDDLYNSSYNVGKYLKNINDTFKNEEKKSLTDILTDFQYMTNDFSKLNDYIEQNKVTYSNPRFDLCTLEEKRNFVNTQLQLIETLVTDKIWAVEGNVWNWYDILSLMYNKDYANVQKTERKVIFSTAQYKRPIGDQSYNLWNGLQIIDIDIKNPDIANPLKDILFNELNKYQWFLGVCLSASKKSLHVWTKITPISRELNSRRIEFRCNFRQKYSYIYIILLKYMDKLGYTKDDILSYLDNAMAKPQQGVFISSDHPYLNTNFMDLRLDVTFESAINTGIESINWITYPDLREIFAKLEWFDNDKKTADNVDIENIENIDYRSEKHGLPIHYLYTQRWQLANTLTRIYGPDKALSILLEICADAKRAELQGYVKTSALHNKPISKWAIYELNNKHGFKLKLKQNLDEIDENIQKADEEIKNSKASKDPIKVLNEHTNVINLYITKDQYLSDIKDDILKNLSKITLLEAGAGYGKTEMVKAFKAKTLLILPFTSIIKSKIELDENTADWKYYYGNKKPTLEELMDPNQSMSMTIDKFSHLNLMEIDHANFEYIVVDESHLLFTSSYRSVMSPTIQRLANCKAKVIMMTGTPTAEVLFFPKINHIVVAKEETRIKEFNTYFCPSEYEQVFEMVDAMARDIKNGVKILWPTNKGNTHFEQIIALLQDRLRKYDYYDQVKAFYYKKSNYGDDSMDNINRNKSIGDNDIIGCTTYLSVGIDICDSKPFHIYFDEPMIAQDIEQYANRIRRNDLYIKLFLPLSIGGNLIDWFKTSRMDLSIHETELIKVRDLIKTANDMIERNQEESKFNPIILSMLSQNAFLKYDEIDCKYYIDETAYKLNFFEKQYIDYGKQIMVIKSGMDYYGYTTSEITLKNTITDVKKLEIDDLKAKVKHRRWDENTQNTRKFLSHITDSNIDIYKEVLKGNYSIFKDPDEKYKEIRGENNLYVESIEIMEKNTPIVLSLYRFYSIETIKDIYEFCIDKKSNRLNHSKLDRIRRLVNIEYNKRLKKLDFPILKYVNDAQKFATEHPSVTKNEINMFNAKYTTSYANSIEGLVVQDNDYLEDIFAIVQDLWKCIIIEGKPNKQGNISITPFVLTWTRKDLLNDVYGDENTREFLIQCLEDEMDKKIEEEHLILEDLPDFEIKGKKTIEDVKPELKDVIHENFEYNKYAVDDGSNERFMRKQVNTYNKEILDKIELENQNKQKDNENNSDTIKDTLFDDKAFMDDKSDLPI